jgi:hypothetical protein
MEALLLVAEHDGPTMFARIGVMRAMNRHVERVFKPDRETSIGDAGSWRGIDAAASILTARAQTEADHFMKCPGCGEWFDMRDLARMLAHVHDAEIEIGEGTEPPARGGPLL